jgi:hypothetical protein
MSKLSDYSKFDHLKDDEDDDDDDDNNNNDKHHDDETGLSTTTAMQPPPQPQPQHAQQTPPLSPVQPLQKQPMSSIHRDETRDDDRYYFQYNGQRVYDFQQDLDQMTIFVRPPPHVHQGRQIHCEITANHLKLKLVGSTDWYLNEDTYGTVDVDESTWSLEDDDDENTKNGANKVLCIYLTKANRGTLWDAALKGNHSAQQPQHHLPPPPTLDEFSKEQVKRKLMLQRFQEENPGFDFRGAEFNGSAPDPREFMGGVKYQ